MQARTSVFRTVRLGLVGAGLAAALSACGGGGDRPPERGDVAVARIGERAVWRSDVLREARAQNLLSSGQPLDSGSPLFRRVLDEVIDQRLLTQEAERRGLDRTPEGERRLAAARDRALGDMLLEQTVDRAVSDAAVQALYREQLRLSRRGEQFRARRIVLRTSEEAAAVRRQLDAGGDFAALATERSVDAATRTDGGEIGDFTLASAPPEYAAVLASTQAGQVVGPFAVASRETPAVPPTWVILKLESRQPQPAPTLAEARPRIRRFLSFDQISELVQTLRRGAPVQYLVVLSPAPEEPVLQAAPAPAAGAPASAVDTRPGGSDTPTASPGTGAPQTARPTQ